MSITFDLNHQDNTLAPAPLNVSGMQAGHTFLRPDGAVNPNGQAVGFNVHLGSTGCAAASKYQTPPKTHA